MRTETKLLPSDLIVITTQEESPLLKLTGQSVHVGLKIEETLGMEAAHAWVQYELCSRSDSPREGYYFDPQKAREAYEKFTEIAGFSPDELSIEIYAQEKEHDFSTKKL